MKFVFVVNPTAGKGNWWQALQKEVENVFSQDKGEYEFHVTQAPGEAIEFVFHYPLGPACFVACGGDGTLNEVITGLRKRGTGIFAAMPYGSGNDFVRAFGDLDAFRCVKGLLNGKIHDVDLLDCQGRYAVNLCNLGFDADVVVHAAPLKKIPFCPGPVAYAISVLRTLFGKISRPLEIQCDNHPPLQMETLLCVMANGRYCGGGFCCAPLSQLGDGLLDVVAVEKVTRLTFLRLVKHYYKGNHLTDPRFREMVHFSRARQVTVRGNQLFSVCVDGEAFQTREFTVKILPQALSFLVPEKAAESLSVQNSPLSNHVTSSHQ